MTKIAGIKAVSFDGDGTLWNFEKSMRRSLLETIKELEKRNPKAASMLDIEKMIEIRDKVAREQRNNTTDLNEIRQISFKEILKSIGMPDNKLAAHLCKLYFRHRLLSIELYSDAPQTLNALKQKYTLGLISNGNIPPKHCSLENIFHFTIFSADYAVRKPDPKIFAIAQKKAGCSKDELLHVGDSLEDDIMGASKAGIRSVWLNRNGIRNNTSTKPDYEISSLRELINIL